VPWRPAKLNSEKRLGTGAREAAGSSCSCRKESKGRRAAGRCGQMQQCRAQAHAGKHQEGGSTESVMKEGMEQSGQLRSAAFSQPETTEGAPARGLGNKVGPLAPAAHAASGVEEPGEASQTRAPREQPILSKLDLSARLQTRRDWLHCMLCPSQSSG